MSFYGVLSLIYLFRKVLLPFPDNLVRFTGHDTGIAFEIYSCWSQVIDEIKLAHWISTNNKKK